MQLPDAKMQEECRGMFGRHVKMILDYSHAPGNYIFLLDMLDRYGEEHHGQRLPMRTDVDMCPLLRCWISISFSACRKRNLLWKGAV